MILNFIISWFGLLPFGATALSFILGLNTFLRCLSTLLLLYLWLLTVCVLVHFLPYLLFDNLKFGLRNKLSERVDFFLVEESNKIVTKSAPFAVSL